MQTCFVLSPRIDNDDRAVMAVSEDYPGDWTDQTNRVMPSGGEICLAYGVITEDQYVNLIADPSYCVMSSELKSWLRDGQVWVASPDGLDTNTGRLRAPMDFATALVHAEDGDLVLLRHGTYISDVAIQTAITRPGITITNARGEIAALDYRFKLAAERITFVSFDYGLEIYSNNTQRISEQTGSAPTDIPTWGGIEITKTGCQIINVRVHDAGTGIYWYGPYAGLIYGTICYDNGWLATVGRNHGHDIYTHNHVDGITKSVENCVSLNPLSGNGLVLYSATINNVLNYRVTDCVSANAQIVIGSEQGLTAHINIERLRTWKSALLVGRAENDIDNNDVTLTNSLVSNRVNFSYYFHRIKDLNVQNNIFDGAAIFYTHPTSGTQIIDNNSYINLMYYAKVDGVTIPVDYPTHKLNLTQWRDVSGFDTHSDHQETSNVTQSFYTVNLYAQKYITLTIYNWQSLLDVNVPVPWFSGICRVHNPVLWSEIQDCTITNGEALIPMSGWTNRIPIGLDEPVFDSTFPAFGCFILEHIE